jgi:hypothetical protein
MRPERARIAETPPSQEDTRPHRIVRADEGEPVPTMRQARAQAAERERAQAEAARMSRQQRPRGVASVLKRIVIALRGGSST